MIRAREAVLRVSRVNVLLPEVTVDLFFPCRAWLAPGPAVGRGVRIAAPIPVGADT